MRFTIRATGPGTSPEGAKLEADDPVIALTHLREMRAAFLQAEVRVVGDDGREVSEDELVRLHAERDAAVLKKLRSPRA